MIVTAARPRRLPSLRPLQAICSRRYVSQRPSCCRANVTGKTCPRARHYSSKDIAAGAASFPSTGDTIYALSSGAGRAGIAVIRISGPSCLSVSDIPDRSLRVILLTLQGLQCLMSWEEDPKTKVRNGSDSLPACSRDEHLGDRGARFGGFDSLLSITCDSHWRGCP